MCEVLREAFDERTSPRRARALIRRRLSGASGSARRALVLAEKLVEASSTEALNRFLTEQRARQPDSATADALPGQAGSGVAPRPRTSERDRAAGAHLALIDSLRSLRSRSLTRSRHTPSIERSRSYAVAAACTRAIVDAARGSGREHAIRAHERRWLATTVEQQRSTALYRELFELSLLAGRKAAILEALAGCLRANPSERWCRAELERFAQHPEHYCRAPLSLDLHLREASATPRTGWTPMEENTPASPARGLRGVEIEGRRARWFVAPSKVISTAHVAEVVELMAQPLTPEGRNEFLLVLTGEGSRRLAAATRRLASRHGHLAIVLGGELVEVPRVMAVIEQELRLQLPAPLAALCDSLRIRPVPEIPPPGPQRRQ